MKLGKSIRIYLKEGTVTGIKFAELVNQTIQALSCPRNKLSTLNESFEKEINTQGVYFLIGQNENSLKSEVYIGESENVWDRLKSHDLKKEFWSDVIIFTSKDENLTKSHIKYLESRIVETSKMADRYKVLNGNNPTASSLPLPDKDAMEEFLSNIKLITGTLGHKFLEDQFSTLNTLKEKFQSNEETESDSNDKSNTEYKLFLNVKGIKASAIQTDEGLVVLQDSEVATNPTKNYGYGALRGKLINDGIIQEVYMDKLMFVKNHLFTSASAAAAVILGYSVNGRTSWKDKHGLTIKEIEKRKISKS